MGFRVWGLGFGVYGLGWKVYGSGFRVMRNYDHSLAVGSKVSRVGLSQASRSWRAQMCTDTLGVSNTGRADISKRLSKP